jgi:hypothetical protein
MKLVVVVVTPGSSEASHAVGVIVDDGLATVGLGVRPIGSLAQFSALVRPVPAGNPHYAWW